MRDSGGFLGWADADPGGRGAWTLTQHRDPLTQEVTSWLLEYGGTCRTVTTREALAIMDRRLDPRSARSWPLLAVRALSMKELMSR